LEEAGRMKRDIITERKAKRGEIYWINPSPYRGTGQHVQRASRPAVIVSNDKINDTGKTYEVVYLTTKPKKDCDTHVTIRSSYERSTALCEQVQTISVEQLGRYIADCTEQEMEAISRSILISLDLDISAPDPEPKSIESIGRIWIEEKRLKVMRMTLDKAQSEAEFYHRLYDELLEKMIRAAAK
jgi:mRNA interferase MazF